MSFSKHKLNFTKGEGDAPFVAAPHNLMKVSEIMELLDAELIYGEDLIDREVFSACGSDMMSDVLAYVKEQAVLLTGLVNPQVVRTAEMMDMKCIVFVRGKSPDMGMIDLAEEMGIPLLKTKCEMFTSCGILYEHGLRGGAKWKKQ